MNFLRRLSCLAMFLLLPLPLLAQTGASCPKQFVTTPAASGAVSPQEEVHGLNPADLDRTANPCLNFFQFADGGWVAKHPIPPAYSSWGTFNDLLDHNQAVLHQILDEAAADKSAAPGSNEQKIGDFYASCMNEAEIEKEGIAPLQPEFDRIKAISNPKELQAEVARLQSMGVEVMFRFGATQDFKNSSQVVGAARQGGTGLPDRDYYLNPEDRDQKIRTAYVAHVANMFKLMGDDPDAAAKEAQTVMDIETSLAKVSMDRVAMRNPEALYHKMDVAGVQALTPDFSWNAYLEEIGYPDVATIIVGQPDFFKGLAGQLTSVPLADWKTYLRWHLVSAAAPALSSKFVEENFDFYTRTLTGAKEMLPRWKRCTQATDRQLGEALGQKYVARAFPPEAREAALKMVHNLINALHDDLQTLPWMSDETKKQATEKLSHIMLKVGYPDKWRDYSEFKVDRGPYVENLLRGDAFRFRYEMNKIGKPVDRGEWGMTPPTVNAYYSPTYNEIVFPAGILQPPFFDPKADDALNYGGIGAVIGHEMTHGFDDQGRKFDAQGNLRDWWTPEDAKNFEARAECVQKQFDSYEVQPGVHENGKLVLGESIADLGGLTIALKAFQKTPEGQTDKTIDGFTPVQRFFLAWARTWAASQRPQVELLLVKTNPHPLDRFRAVAPPSNMDAFQQAFACKAGDTMVRSGDQVCRIW
ncbi:MAG TPA: M13 family metallopeptidase [Candidatus Acidoferrales bacterium]|nr:M13 family metallopeptidase [Candidatus Acidoferrales bacterium]